MVYHKNLDPKIVKDLEEFSEAEKSGYSADYIKKEEPKKNDEKGEELILALESVAVLEEEIKKLEEQNEKLLLEVEKLKSPKKGK